MRGLQRRPGARISPRNYQNMVFSHIDKLKKEYTDKFVAVDEQCPELRRFGGMTGVVKTVNMNGRALVQFEGRNNTGWYDIDVNYLRVIDEPLATDETPVAAVITSPKAPSALERARSGKAGPKSKESAKKTADILQAARAGKAAVKSGEESRDPPKKKPSTADILAAARAGKPADSAKPAAQAQIGRTAGTGETSGRQAEHRGDPGRLPREHSCGRGQVERPQTKPETAGQIVRRRRSNRPSRRQQRNRRAVS